MTYIDWQFDSPLAGTNVQGHPGYRFASQLRRPCARHPGAPHQAEGAQEDVLPEAVHPRSGAHQQATFPGETLNIITRDRIICIFGRKKKNPYFVHLYPLYFFFFFSL